MDRSNILGFPNPMPNIDWLKNLPVFKDEKGDDVVIHLLRFHMRIRRSKIQIREVRLMKMFVESLEEKARSWYEDLPAASISYLKCFHVVFCDKHNEYYPSLSLVQDYCDKFQIFIEYLEDYYDDDQFMNE